MSKHGNMGKFTEKELVEILNKYGTLSNNEEESILDKTLTSKDKKHEIKVREIWNEPFKKEKISFSIDAEARKNTGYGNVEYGGSFEVEEGTTWEEFFCENFANDVDGWNYATYDGSVVLFMREDSRWGGYCYLLNRENPKEQIKKYDSIKSGNYYVDETDGYFVTWDESSVSVFNKDT